MAEVGRVGVCVGFPAASPLAPLIHANLPPSFLPSLLFSLSLFSSLFSVFLSFSLFETESQEV